MDRLTKAFDQLSLVGRLKITARKRIEQQLSSKDLRRLSRP